MAPFNEVAALLYEGPWVAERYAAIAPVPRQARARACIPSRARIIEKAQGVLGRRRLRRPLSARGAAARDRAACGAASTRSSCRPRPARRRSPRSRPTRSAPTRGSAPTPTSSTCSTSPPSPCPGPFRKDGRAAGITFIGAARTRRGAGKPRRARFHAAAATTIGATGRPLPPLEPLPATAPAGTHRACRRRRASLRPGAQPRAARARRRASCARSRPSRPTGSTRCPAARRSGRAWCASPPAPATPSPPRCGRCRPRPSARFVAGIPAPLGIGTLLLADGTRPKGFLCEAEAIRAARDISSFGGWRAYLAAKG